MQALGTSDIFLDFQERLGLLARSDRPVLVVGERGTGKELAAQRLHYLSGRWERPLVTVLCPALSSTLLESELFGHEAGSFTGARGRHAGYFERADGGTLFLDEVADMPLPLQDRLLRVIEYGAFERVGGTGTVRVDVRVVAATNRDLPEMARQGRFRADLLDRLAFDVLHVPPLRLRGEDRLLLACHFALGMAAELGLDTCGPEGKTEIGSSGTESPRQQEGAPGPVWGAAALEQLEKYPWPGNVRELKNVVERTVARRRTLHLDSLELDPFMSPYGEGDPGEDRRAGCPAAREEAPSQDAAARVASVVPAAIGEENAALPPDFRLPEEIRRLERSCLERALRQSRYQQKVAARLLGISYHQFRALYRKLQALEVTDSEEGK